MRQRRDRLSILLAPLTGRLGPFGESSGRSCFAEGAS
jgi:hypothetical protein